MDVLLVAATKSEIEPLLNQGKALSSKGNRLSFLITGVGMTATAYALGRELALNKYDLAVNAGIAGSFDPSIKIGSVVKVKEDWFAELGAEDENLFIAIDDLGFGESRVSSLYSLQQDTAINLEGLRSVKAITVNTVHGNLKSIEAVTERLKPEIETMEGAAFFYACNQAQLPCIQIRAISNYVEKRNKANWNIPLAIENLSRSLTEILNLV